MIHYFIDLVGSYANSGIFPYLIYPVLALAFLVTVPSIIRAFLGR